MADFSSAKAKKFTESVIREMTRLCVQHGAVNLSQGFPDFPAPQKIKDDACAAIQRDINQYAITWGSRNLRQAVAEHTKRFYGVDIDPERQVTVACGSTEAMFSAMMAVVDPGDEVIVFEPYYENYGPDAILCGAVPRYVSMRAPEWKFNPDELRAAFNDKTKALILNSPCNPTGKVFTRAEMELIAELCLQHNVVVITDEIYEHMVYPGHEHVFFYGLPGMADRTISIGGLSKTFSVTGWRIGYCIASPEITASIRKVHDFVSVGAAAPLQEAAAEALRYDDKYYTDLAAMYLGKRDLLVAGLEKAGFRCTVPEAAYYIMTDISGFGFPDDVTFVKHLITEVGVGAVPGSSFYSDRKKGAQQVRFCFCKKEETLHEALRRLEKLRVSA